MKKISLKKLLLILLKVMFFFAMMLCLARFTTAEDVFDKVNYGMWFIIGLIVTFAE